MIVSIIPTKPSGLEEGGFIHLETSPASGPADRRKRRHTTSLVILCFLPLHVTSHSCSDETPFSTLFTLYPYVLPSQNRCAFNTALFHSFTSANVRDAVTSSNSSPCFILPITTHHKVWAHYKGFCYYYYYCLFDTCTYHHASTQSVSISFPPSICFSTQKGLRSCCWILAQFGC